MLAYLLFALLALPGSPIAPADTTWPVTPPPPAPPAASDDGEEGVEFGVGILPSAFYSPSKGIGAGVRLTVDHLLARGTEFRLSAEPTQRSHRYRASFFTSDPFEGAPVFAGFSGRYERDEVRAFYGLGANSSRDDKLYVDIEEVEAELRTGWYPFASRRLLVQPVVRLLHERVLSFRDREDGAFVRIGEASRRSLFTSVQRPTTGVTYGLELAVDTRDRLLYSTRGVLALLTGRRYDGLGDDAFRYGSATATLYGFVPLPADRHVLLGRAVFAFTRRIGDTPIPFYALPTLDDDLVGAYAGERFTGHDLVVLTAAYRFPIFNFLDWFALDGNVAVSAANAYDNVFEQGELGLSFSREPDERGRTPLRPSISVGGRLVNLDGDRIVIGGQLGFGPEGYRVGTLRLVYGIRDLEPVVR